ncbi:hypothetical protein [Candidatus Similichlamydia laticola]|nr:hypothetical protein [Candidatus Similichlamydia laticola]
MSYIILLIYLVFCGLLLFQGTTLQRSSSYELDMPLREEDSDPSQDMNGNDNLGFEELD